MTSSSFGNLLLSACIPSKLIMVNHSVGVKRAKKLGFEVFLKLFFRLSFKCSLILINSLQVICMTDQIDDYVAKHLKNMAIADSTANQVNYPVIGIATLAIMLYLVVVVLTVLLCADPNRQDRVSLVCAALVITALVFVLSSALPVV